MNKENELLANLGILAIAIGSIFYTIFVHQKVYNLFMPRMFGMPQITYLQAFVIDLVLGAFRSNATLQSIETYLKKEVMDKTSERAFAIHKVLITPVESTIVLAISYLIAYIVF